ncbi:MAG TPA: hypothetical protein VMN04_12985, partial [Thermoanaerobaculia bacterium]|nr:hypothetical protein [Thermoanaerobaculia bacterium]
MSPEQKPGRPRGAGRRAAAAALALILSAGPALSDDVVSVPVASRARKPVPLPAGDTIQLSLSQAIELTLQ